MVRFWISLCCLVVCALGHGEGSRDSNFDFLRRTRPSARSSSGGSIGSSPSSPTATPTPTPAPPPAVKQKTAADLKAPLVVDIGTGAPGEDEAARLLRLQQVVFTINSLNSSNAKLLTVNDLLKENFPPKGEIPKTGPAKVLVELADYLDAKQIETFSAQLADHPLNCLRKRGLTEGIRADIVMQTAFAPQNYNALMVTPSRADFEKATGVGSEFDANEAETIRTADQRHRILLGPGQSGIVHAQAQRKIVLERAFRDGKRQDALVVRTEDVEKHNATKDSHNFAAFPVTAKGDAHEEIWTLPNGMLAYALRARDGKVQTSAPPTIVTRAITNPISCMKCHDSGFVATTGNSGSLSLESLNKNPPFIEDEKKVGKSFFQYKDGSYDYDTYNKYISGANEKYKKALEASSLKPRAFQKAYGDFDGDLSPEQLAAELGVSVEDVTSAIVGAPGRFKRSPLNFAAWKAYAAKTGDAPMTTRADLERSVPLAGDRRRSLFCAIREQLVEASEARLWTPRHTKQLEKVHESQRGG